MSGNTSRVKFGYPEVYGKTNSGYCGHCNGKPEHAVKSAFGIFCVACFRWQTYIGPPQQWGDGMNVTK